MITRTAFAALCMVASASASAGSIGDAMRGARLYDSRCIGCHSVDSNRIGPLHRGVFGRAAGTVPGFNYSRALETSGLVWTDETLERWLANPQALVPGQRMNFRVSAAQDRADLVAFLRTLTP